MRYVLLVTALLALTISCLGQDFKTDKEFRQFLAGKTQEAIGLLQDGEYDQAISIYTMLLDLPAISSYENARAGIHYNLACAYALSGRKAEALASLASAVELGFANRTFIEEDPDLEILRGEPGYQRIMTTIRAQEGFWSSPSLVTEYRKEIGVDEKIAGLAELWSEVKYNFAFFDQVPDLDWDSLFVAYLPKVRESRSTLEYYRTLETMCAHLKDGHTRITPPSALWDSLWARPPIRTGLVEGRVIVQEVSDEGLRAGGIVPGMEIIAIDGMPARRYAEEEVMPYQCASTEQGLAEQTYNYSLLSGPVDRKVELSLEDASGEVFTRSLSRTRDQATRQVFEFRWLTDGIAYVALNSFGSDDVVSRFDSVFASIQTAPALVIDLRENQGGNSDLGYQILRRLTSEPFKMTSWRSRRYVPTFRAWGMAPSWYRPVPSEYQPNAGEAYGGSVVVLTGPQTASAAEDFCVAFSAMDRGIIVGQPTYGSTGQPLVFRLPGGGSAQVCTKHDTYPGGTEYVGVGVLPDVEVSPTVKDVRSGRDPVLERAVAYLSNGEGGPIPGGEESEILRVCEGVLRLFESEAGAVWPGYSLSEQPFIVYVPDRWALLFNPSGPVEGFGPYPEAWPDPGAEVLYHEGRYDDLAGQLAFDLPLGETTALAVGFPPGYFRGGEHPAVEALSFVVHEAFHQYQRWAFGEIPWAREEMYPISDERNGALAWLEMRLLEKSLEAAAAGDSIGCRERAKEFVAVRLERWASGDPFIRRYEQGEDLQEGTAKYVELRCVETMAGVHYTSTLDGRSDPMAASFPLVTMPELVLRELKGRMGEGCLEPQDIPRNRIYAVAAAEACLLDYFGVPWKDQAQRAGPEFTYADLLGAQLGLGEGEVDRLADKARREFDFESTLACAADAAKEYRRAYQDELEAFEGQTGLRLEIITPASGLSRSRVSRARKWTMDDGRFLLCSDFRVYTLQGRDWNLEVHDAGLLEENDWDKGTKSVIFYDAGADSVYLGERAEVLVEGTRDFASLELKGERFELASDQPGRLIVEGDTIRVVLTRD